MIIKLILIVSILVVAVFLVRSTSNTKNVALRRLLLLAFVLLALFSILFPAITTKVAQAIGVGRGADLILYLLVIAFLSYSVVSYRRMNILENRITDLARQLALAQSNPHSHGLTHPRGNPAGDSAKPRTEVDDQGESDGETRA